MSLRVSRFVRNGPRILALALFLLLLAPGAAWASGCQPDSVCFSNVGGTMTGGTGGLFLNGSNGSTLSTLTEIDGNALAMPGTLSFTTGSLISGNLGTLKAGQSVDFNPGTFSITGTFADFTGTLFTATFGAPGSPIVWTLLSISGKGKNAVYTYALSGPITGTWYNGTTVSGATTQLLFKSKGGPYTGGSIGLENGSSFVVTPEPGTLGLMGTGLLGLGLTVRRRVKDRMQARRVVRVELRPETGGSHTQAVAPPRVAES